MDVTLVNDARRFWRNDTMEGWIHRQKLLFLSCTYCLFLGLRLDLVLESVFTQRFRAVKSVEGRHLKTWLSLHGLVLLCSLIMMLGLGALVYSISCSAPIETHASFNSNLGDQHSQRKHNVFSYSPSTALKKNFILSPMTLSSVVWWCKCGDKDE